MEVVVKRSAFKMWLMAIGGIPLLVLSLDVLTERRITRWLTDLIFRPEDVQIYEPRDVIWAWVILGFGATFVLWGLKELFIPTRVVECTDDGLAMRLSGPLKGPSLVPWDNIQDVGGDEVLDEGDKIPVLVLSVFDRSDLPSNPWGARWVNEKELAVMAQDWASSPERVAEKIANYAVDAARRQRAKDTARLWQEEE